MPELPEVETTVRGLKKALNRVFLDVWTDTPKIIKKPKILEEFKKEIKNKKILEVKRVGKNIVFSLSGGLSLLVHQKMTGHLLLGKWEKINGNWMAKGGGPIKKDPMNRFIRLIFFFNNKKQMALSDLRKFAKVELAKTEEINQETSLLGPDPLKIKFKQFREIFRRERGKIKQILMKQETVSGIGNIYSDEILFRARIHPLKYVCHLSEKELGAIYRATVEILKKAVKMKGTSVSDYRAPNGEKGMFGKERKVYRLEGRPCIRCKTKIRRLKIGGRSAHYCSKCQKI